MQRVHSIAPTRLKTPTKRASVLLSRNLSCHFDLKVFCNRLFVCCSLYPHFVISNSVNLLSAHIFSLKCRATKHANVKLTATSGAAKTRSWKWFVVNCLKVFLHSNQLVVYAIGNAFAARLSHYCLWLFPDICMIASALVRIWQPAHATLHWCLIWQWQYYLWFVEEYSWKF